MFWKRRDDFTKDQVATILNIPPVQKEFGTMLEMLRDAEKYANGKEVEVSNNILKCLCEYIDKHREKESPKS